MKIANKSALLIMIIFTLSIAIHLVGLNYPKQVVFDEVHFGKFVTAYCCTHERFFDIHPPHAKLLIAGAVRLSGYDGTFDFDHIGESYGRQSIFAFRIVPALFGSLLPLVIFCLLRLLKASRPLAFIGAWAVLFDNAILVQSRLILLDAMLLTTVFGALACILASEKSAGWRQWVWIIASGALAGLAVGTKFTGLVALGLVGLIIVVKLLRQRTVQQTIHWFGAGLAIIISAVLVYYAGWAIHFALLPLPGSGDAFITPNLNQGLTAAAIVRETNKLQSVMFAANAGLSASHPDASSWWSWPLMQKSVFYWHDKGASIYFLGNPVVWWGSTVLFIIAVGSQVLGRVIKKTVATNYRNWIPLVGFMAALVPLISVSRVLFLYHYLTSLVFAIIFSVLWVDQHPKINRYFSSLKSTATVLTLTMILIGFVIISPLTFGIPLPESALNRIFLIQGWR